MRYLALMMIACLLSSCATIVRGRDEVIAVDSNPSGATAKIQCAGNVSASGTTPARLTIPRKADGCNLSIEKSGMLTKNVVLERGFNGWYWGNFGPTVVLPVTLFANSLGDHSGTTNAWLAFGLAGAAGFVVDRLTGAMYDHDPHVIKVTLQPEH